MVILQAGYYGNITGWIGNYGNITGWIGNYGNGPGDRGTAPGGCHHYPGCRLAT